MGALVGVAAACGGDVTGPPLPSGAELRLIDPVQHVVANRQPLPQLRVWAVDPGGDRLELSGGEVAFRLVDHPSGAELVGETVAPVRLGEAVFTNLRIDRPARGLRLEAVYRGSEAAVRSGLFHAVEAPDLIRIGNARPGFVGLLVDGRDATGFVRDTPFFSTTREVEVILERAAEPTGSNEVVAFQQGRAPALTPSAPWSEGVDTVDLSLIEPVEIPVTVWVIGGGTFDSVRAKAEASLEGARAIFEDEAAGIQLVDLEIVDATDDPDAPNYLDFPFEGDDLFKDIGRREGRINVYGIRLLDGSRIAGRGTIGGDRVMIAAEGWRSRIVAHEIGHNFSLTHPGSEFSKSRSNLMRGGFGLTEGQIFHMHFNTISVLNRLFDIRTEHERLCPNAVVDPGPDRPRCPQLDLRLWGDPTEQGNARSGWAASTDSPGNLRVGTLVP